MEDRTPFTYLIGWSKENIWYYGARYAKNCDPTDLWVKYYTSSKSVKEYRVLLGEPDVIQIRKTFKSIDKCLDWEFKVLRRLNAIKKHNWLNKSAAGLKFYVSGPKSLEWKKKIQESHIGKKKPWVSIMNHNRIGKENPRFGIPTTKGKKLYTDPITKIEKFFDQDCQPTGWIKGTLSDRNKGKNNPRYQGQK